jgi:hypothetical protein
MQTKNEEDRDRAERMRAAIDDIEKMKDFDCTDLISELIDSSEEGAADAARVLSKIMAVMVVITIFRLHGVWTDDMTETFLEQLEI